MYGAFVLFFLSVPQKGKSVKTTSIFFSTKTNFVPPERHLYPGLVIWCAAWNSPADHSILELPGIELHLRRTTRTLLIDAPKDTVRLQISKSCACKIEVSGLGQRTSISAMGESVCRTWLTTVSMASARWIN
jgi:hypothetical protein